MFDSADPSRCHALPIVTIDPSSPPLRDSDNNCMNQLNSSGAPSNASSTNQPSGPPHQQSTARARLLALVQTRFRRMPVPTSTSKHLGILESPKPMKPAASAATDDLTCRTAPTPPVELCSDGFPMYKTLVAKGPTAHGELFCRSPWFDREPILNNRLLASYTDVGCSPRSLAGVRRLFLALAPLRRGFDYNPRMRSL
ncbi:hypothetical protein BWQ96_07801 [Gracilariopsis chorda]|uniref:Uncharacterized protein n=1 Tax=Gracilariopsis chorda TaxID=448386 RepID=A0A2V3IK92_9FLOR|nr:hypothetical protein BWQ96_07801 [Gracilariopsis chorda]|eukprot:PXF42463.1 hypothetical protein BWQ96_07801 [Gracilariopsis chorda]